MDEKIITQLRIIKLSGVKPNYSELSRIYNIDRRTIKKYCDGYEGKPAHRCKPSKLDDHIDLIKQKLGIKGIKVKAVYEFVYKKDHDIGTYSNFAKYLKRKGLKPVKTEKGHPRFETAPGFQAQADWKEDLTLANRHGELFTIQVFNYKLGHSRYCHFVYKSTKTQQDVFDCLIDSFKATGGVPREILFDNMASIVSFNGKYRRINNKAKAFADDFGFKIRLAKPRHPYTKGKVETSNKFLDWLLSYEGEFETEADLMTIIADINKDVNEAVCQGTGVPPILLFQKEKEYLQPLPNEKVLESYLSHGSMPVKVQTDSLIYYDKHRYSVPPAYIGKSVYVRPTNDDKLFIYHDTDLIAVHRISAKRMNYQRDHYETLLLGRIHDEDAVSEIARRNLEQMDDFL